MSTKPVRPIEAIKKDIKAANQAIDRAERDLCDAENWLTDLEDELKNRPPEDIEEREVELWFARRDPRQLSFARRP